MENKTNPRYKLVHTQPDGSVSDYLTAAIQDTEYDYHGLLWVACCADSNTVCDNTFRKYIMIERIDDQTPDTQRSSP